MSSLNNNKVYNLIGNSQLWNFTINNRYIIVSTILIAILFFQILYGQWYDDFWEHSAVVKELSTNPTNPQHPLLDVDKSHPFYSPYLLLVGIVAKAFSLSPVTALSIFGLLNVVIFLISFRLFIGSLVDKYLEATSFYSIILVLFLWTAAAWDWSGFLHFKILGLISPYPSTFSIALTFLIFALFNKGLKSNSIPKYAMVTLLTTIVILNHPTTGIVTFLGIISIALNQFKLKGLKSISLGVLILLSSMLIALLWPYYSLAELVYYRNSEFNSDSYVFYSHIKYLWPTIILLPFALPAIASRFKNNKFDSLVLLVLGTVLVYIGGYVFGQFGIGRIVSFVAVFMQIALAIQLAIIENEKINNRSWSALPVVFYVIVIISLNPINRAVLSRAYMGLRGIKYNYSNYEILKNDVQQYDVILSDINTSWMIPTFNGKIIASRHIAHWVDDHSQRKSDLKKFFSIETEQSEKYEIMNRYNVDFILVNKNIFKETSEYEKYGNNVSENQDFVLIKISK